MRAIPPRITRTTCEYSHLFRSRSQRRASFARTSITGFRLLRSSCFLCARTAWRHFAVSTTLSQYLRKPSRNQTPCLCLCKAQHPMSPAGCFDMASPQQVCSRRVATTTAPQALALINSDLVYQWSQALASRVIRETTSNPSARIDRLYEISSRVLPIHGKSKLHERSSTSKRRLSRRD